ncbi:oxidoreductase [Bacillus manliponensis]|uniref:Oxidoreductase n=1 Tax=Bacillus manliponensis TaxID=574376 RepID=A0A073JWH7_9BACI|nr:NAD(P)-binding domain-containing protein [Bacillus manliponensis]KEK18611.1 oxidoreductase [Bacillus manliponensis]
MINRYNTIIVGAGQAGLAMGYYLRDITSSFLLIESHARLGDSWRLRYDSLILFTPRSHSALPGMSLPGNQNGYPTKDELADYLEEYSEKFHLPVKLNTKITKVFKEKGNFHIITNSGEEFSTKNLIIATGPFQQPYIPDFSDEIPNDIFQIHSAYYKNPSQLKEGTTLVVGGGNSGMQIATELSSTREVYISLGKKPKFLPYQVLNKSIFWWFGVLGLSRLTVDSKLGQALKKNDPIIGKEIIPLVKEGKVKMLPRTTGFIDQKVKFENGNQVQPENIIWATGFKPDYNWLDISNIFDKKGLPIHERGVTKEPGLFFIGLSWQYRRGSALLLGVGEDAEFLVGKLQTD